MRPPAVAVGLALLVATPLRGEEAPRLLNPYERVKNGPPLTNVVHKMEIPWIWTKLRRPDHHPSARMPPLGLADDEARDVLAYLASVSDPGPPGPGWPTWAAKTFEEMSGDEAAEADALVERGKGVWGRARCTICHRVRGPGGGAIGGFVDLRVGGTDLDFASGRLKRGWLYDWIRDPKRYFPRTLMPRYDLTDDEVRGLVEFILRDDSFQPAAPPDGGGPEPQEVLGARADRTSRGRRVIEMSRCVVCHDIRGIPEVLPPQPEDPAPQKGTFEWVVHDRRCLTCHAVSGRGGTYAPDLTGAGSRLQLEWVREFVQRPDLVRPLSQQMPRFNLSAEEGALVADFVAAHLRASAVPDEIPGGKPREDEEARGRELFESKGCRSCHGVGEGPGGVVGPDLADVGGRLRPGALWQHLGSPRARNPHSQEPDLALGGDEARALAVYLSTKRRRR